MVTTVSQILKKQNFPVEPKLGMWKVWYQQYIGIWHKSQEAYFPRRVQRTVAFGTNHINRDYSDQMALSRHCTAFHGIKNKPPIYDSCFCRTTQFWLSAYLWRSIINVTHKLIFTVVPPWCRKIHEKKLFWYSL